MFNLNKEEKKMVDLTIRPFIIFTILIVIVIIIGNLSGTLPEEEINGIIKTFILNCLVLYCNTSYVELKEKMEKEKNETDAV